MRKLSDPPTLSDELTDIELQTVVLVAAGYSNAVLIEKLGVTEKAIQKRITSIADKLQIIDARDVYHTRCRVVFECLRRDLITLEQATAIQELPFAQPSD